MAADIEKKEKWFLSSNGPVNGDQLNCFSSVVWNTVN